MKSAMAWQGCSRSDSALITGTFDRAAISAYLAREYHAGACVVALRLAEQVENATIVFIVCDRGDRYLSTGVFPA